MMRKNKIAKSLNEYVQCICKKDRFRTKCEFKLRRKGPSELRGRNFSVDIVELRGRNFSVDIFELRGRNFSVDIVIPKLLISISNVDTFKFEHQCFITQLKLFVHDITIMRYRVTHKG